MALPAPFRFAAGAAREVAGAALGVAAGSAALTVGLVAGSARAGYRAARATAGGTAEFVAGSARLAGTVGVEGARITGLVLTGSDPFAAGRTPARVAAAARELFEPEDDRRTRRVWVDGEHAHVELAAPPTQAREVRGALHRHLERLEGVDWVAVNEIVGRVLVGFDQRRISVDEVVGVITAVERARGGRQVFPRRPDHPADIEPLVAAAASLLLNGGAAGVATAGKLLPVPALSRHLTALLALVDAQPRVRDALVDRIGPIGTDLVFTAASAVLHTLTQSPTVPALNAASAAQRVVEVLARRAVWRVREPELCPPVPGDVPAEPEPQRPPGPRPVPLPPGPIETYRRRLAPVTFGGAVGLLALTRAPSRSADLLKGLSPRTATLGREAFAAVLDLLMCRRGVLPMDGSAYRRLDRIDAVVLDGDALCTGPPVVLEATATAPGWDDARVWTAASLLLGNGDDGPLGLGPPEPQPDGGRRHLLLDGDDAGGSGAVGEVVVADELDPLAEALVEAVATTGHRLVLTGHAGVRELAGRVDEVADAAEPLAATVRRLQADGHGVLAVSARDGPGLLAADVGIAPARPGVPPAWGADLLTRPGLAEAWRLVVATDRAHRLSGWVVNSAITGNVLGGLAAAVGRPRSGQRRASAPGKTATAATMVLGSWTALRLDGLPPPAPTAHTPWHASTPSRCCGG